MGTPGLTAEDIDLLASISGSNDDAGEAGSADDTSPDNYNSRLSPDHTTIVPYAKGLVENVEAWAASTDEGLIAETSIDGRGNPIATHPSQNQLQDIDFDSNHGDIVEDDQGSGSYDLGDGGDYNDVQYDFPIKGSTSGSEIDDDLSADGDDPTYSTTDDFTKTYSEE